MQLKIKCKCLSFCQLHLLTENIGMLNESAKTLPLIEKKPIAKHLSTTLVCQIYTQVQFVSQSLLSRELQGSALILVACYWKQDLHRCK